QNNQTGPPVQAVVQPRNTIVAIALPRPARPNAVDFIQRYTGMIHQAFDTGDDLGKHRFSNGWIAIDAFLLNQITLFIDDTAGNRCSANIDSDSIFHSIRPFYSVMKSSDQTNFRL